MFYFGVDYYPEHWPVERWPLDAKLMAEAGFNVVRLAEFAWSKLEPTDGQCDFAWLDQAIEILAQRGIQVILGTPTASAPPWLMAKDPTLYLMREDGRRATYGNRREYCPNHPLYHDYTRRIVAKMAEHYANHPAVIGWQIDNEFGDRCYCPICAGKFHEWLRQRYQSLEELNAKWGTVFWSHIYNDWSEIPPPLATSGDWKRQLDVGGSPNPGLALDYYRFMSDTYVAYQKMQIDLLREKCPAHRITHNLMGFHYKLINYFDLARDLDFVSWDNYQRMQWTMGQSIDPAGAALAHDTMRGLKHQNFWVMEQQAGPGGWEHVSVSPRPGELRLWAYQGIAHGADGIVFFRWRTCRFGTEEYWHGLLDHHGQVGWRYQEIKQMGQEITAVGEQIVGSALKPRVAMLLSYDARFAFQIQQNNPQFNYPDHFLNYYRGFFMDQIPVEIVAPTDDLSGYDILVAPALHLVTDDLAAKLTTFVEAGGTLLVTLRTGVKDDANAVVNLPLPGLLAKICGVEVEEYDSLASNMKNEIAFTLPDLAVTPPAAVGVWCDVLKPTTATVVARYRQDYYAGKPAITVNQHGKGRVVYVGTVGETGFYRVIAKWLMKMAGIMPLMNVPQGIEVTERQHGSERLLFVLNHTDLPQVMMLEGRYQNILNNQTLEGEISIAPRDVFILRPY